MGGCPERQGRLGTGQQESTGCSRMAVTTNHTHTQPWAERESKQPLRAAGGIWGAKQPRNCCLLPSTSLKLLPVPFCYPEPPIPPHFLCHRRGWTLKEKRTSMPPSTAGPAGALALWTGADGGGAHTLTGNPIPGTECDIRRLTEERIRHQTKHPSRGSCYQ